MFKSVHLSSKSIFQLKKFGERPLTEKLTDGNKYKHKFPSSLSYFTIFELRLL